MKKFFLILISLLAIFSFVSCKKSSKFSSKMRIALVTDAVEIADYSFNQSVYEACKEFANSNKFQFEFFRVKEDTNDSRLAQILEAVSKKYNVIVLPGFWFAEPIVKIAEEFKSIKFIAIDISEAAIVSCAERLGKESWKIPSNVFCASYDDSIPGFLVGYAAVKEGYRHLGFVGGVEIPAVMKFGYGYIQGIARAAAELGCSSDIVLEYIYAGQFDADHEITVAIEKWYSQEGVEVVFSCGGAIWTSIAEAASKTGGKVIGVDVDQSALFNKYSPNMCVTSAVKGLGATVKTALFSVLDGTFDVVFGGRCRTFGLVSGSDIDANYVSIPTKSWSMKNFKIEDYKKVVKEIFEGKIRISSDINVMPRTSLKINTHSNIK